MSLWGYGSTSLRPLLTLCSSVGRSLPLPISLCVLSFASEAGSVGRESKRPRIRLQWEQAGQKPALLDFLLVLGATGGGQDTAGALKPGWSCLCVPLPRVIWLLAAVSISDGNSLFHVLRPGSLAEPSVPCRQQPRSLSASAAPEKGFVLFELLNCLSFGGVF